VELMTSPFTVPLHVGDFFRALIDQQHDERRFRGDWVVTEFATDCSIIVLPVRGGATINPRWPLPIGHSMSSTRPVRFSLVVPGECAPRDKEA